MLGIVKPLLNHCSLSCWAIQWYSLVDKHGPFLTFLSEGYDCTFLRTPLLERALPRGRTWDFRAWRWAPQQHKHRAGHRRPQTPSSCGTGMLNPYWSSSLETVACSTDCNWSKPTIHVSFSFITVLIQATFWATWGQWSKMSIQLYENNTVLYVLADISKFGDQAVKGELPEW